MYLWEKFYCVVWSRLGIFSGGFTSRQSRLEAAHFCSGRFGAKPFFWCHPEMKKIHMYMPNCCVILIKSLDCEKNLGTETCRGRTGGKIWIPFCWQNLNSLLAPLLILIFTSNILFIENHSFLFRKTTGCRRALQSPENLLLFIPVQTRNYKNWNTVST